MRASRDGGGHQIDDLTSRSGSGLGLSALVSIAVALWISLTLIAGLPAVVAELDRLVGQLEGELAAL